MRILATPIPSKSHGIRVWHNLEPGDCLPENKEAYSFACNLLHIDDVTCEVAQAIGKFNNEIAIQLGIKAVELGYRKLIFGRATGRAATRWAEFTHTENGLDYYAVDLEAAVRKLNGTNTR